MKSTAERRVNLLVTLCRRRYDTADNLAFEFGVSERTIRNDLYTLSLKYPIEIKSGRGGGIHILGDYQLGMLYLTDMERELLEKLLSVLDETQRPILEKILRKFTKPKGAK